MSRRAWFYIWLVLLAGTTISVLSLPSADQLQSRWFTFVVFTVCASLSQLFEVEAPNHVLYFATPVFVFAGILLLHPFMFVLLVVIYHLVGWIKARLLRSQNLRSWYIQPFNVASEIISGSVAYWVYGTVQAQMGSYGGILMMLSGTLAAIAFVVVSNILITIALVLARGVSWRESGLLDFGNVVADLILLLLGYVVAVLWQLNPWLILPALSPLVLMYRALKVPQLQQQAHTDSKTGLWNAGHFNELFAAELERAQRFGRPLSVLMADLDLLRNINNTYGHLAGDAVLAGIGPIIRKTIREYDIAGRFGGEEFCIVLPETEAREARAIAERIRIAIESSQFTVLTSQQPLAVTMSLGIACFPNNAISANELIHKADVAVYQAKLRGRNRVVSADDVPHSATLEGAMVDRIGEQVQYAAAYATSYAASTASVPRMPAVADAAPAPIGLPEKARQEPPAGARAQAWLRVFVGAVITAGVAIAAVGVQVAPPLNLANLMLFSLLALLAERLHVHVYDRSTMSLSVVVAFATALLMGMPGVMVVSAAIVLMHSLQRKTPLYRTLFNWSVHVIAASVPIAVLVLFDLPFGMSAMPVLAIPLFITTVLYFLIESGLVTMALSLSQRLRFRDTWREQFQWLAPHYLALCSIGILIGVAYTIVGMAAILVFLLPGLMLHYAQRQYVSRTQSGVLELQRMNLELTEANHQIGDANTAIRQLNDELFLTLSKILDARDPTVSGHAARVAQYATTIATELGLAQELIGTIRQAALLHDIGKIGISEQLLHKPGRLTSDEYAIVQTHAVIGADFVETCRGIRNLAPFIRHHHERWDGEGYPARLGGENIPLGARIIGVADAVEAMASERPYHRPLSLDEIVSEVERCGGGQFDPAIAEVFVRLAHKHGPQLLALSAEELAERAPNTTVGEPCLAPFISAGAAHS